MECNNLEISQPTIVWIDCIPETQQIEFEIQNFPSILSHYYWYKTSPDFFFSFATKILQNQRQCFQR